MAENYGYGQADLMAYLLPLLAGASTRQQEDALDVQQKAGNNVMDLLKIMLDPNYAMLFGAYDPALLPMESTFTPQAFTPMAPTLTAYMEGGDPLLQQVANGLFSGQLTPYQAEITLLNSDGFQSATGDRAADARKVVADIWADVKAVEEQRVSFDASEMSRLEQFNKDSADQMANDPFRKAGLPSPFEQYSVEMDPQSGSISSNAPLADDVVMRAMASQMRLQDAEAALNAYKPKLVDPDRFAMVNEVVRQIDRADVDQRPEIGSGAPRSLSEAKKWAEAAGLDPDDVEEWYSRARYSAQPVTDKDSRKVEYDADGWLVMSDAEFSRFEDAWKNVLENKAQIGEGTIFSGITDKTRAGAQKLIAPPPSAKKPRTLPDAPKRQFDFEKAKLENDVSRARVDNRASYWVQQEDVNTMKKQGRSPLNDAVMQRVMMLKTFGLI